MRNNARDYGDRGNKVPQGMSNLRLSSSAMGDRRDHGAVTMQVTNKFCVVRTERIASTCGSGKKNTAGYATEKEP